MLVNQPLFWTSDANGNGALDPNELAVFWGLVPDTKAGAKLGDWVNGATSPRRLPARPTKPWCIVRLGPRPTRWAAPRRSRARRGGEGLAQGRQTLVATDLSKATEEQKNIVRHVLRAAEIIERLYAMAGGQHRGASLRRSGEQVALLPQPEPRARRRSPRTTPTAAPASSPSTRSLPVSYSESIMKQDHFCEALSKLADKQIMDPFTVVRGDAMAPKAVHHRVRQGHERGERLRGRAT